MQCAKTKMREITKEDVINIKRRFDEFAETAEQPMFYAMVKPHMLLDHTIQCFEDYKQKELESMVRVMCGMLSKEWHGMVVDGLSILMFKPVNDNEEAERWLDSLRLS